MPSIITWLTHKRSARQEREQELVAAYARVWHKTQATAEAAPKAQFVATFFLRDGTQRTQTFLSVAEPDAMPPSEIAYRISGVRIRKPVKVPDALPIRAAVSIAKQKRAEFLMPTTGWVHADNGFVFRADDIMSAHLSEVNEH